MMNLILAIMGIISIALGLYFRKGKEESYGVVKISGAGLILMGCAVLFASFINWIAR